MIAVMLSGGSGGVEFKVGFEAYLDVIDKGGCVNIQECDIVRSN